jgi:hypothetical protein
VLCGIGDIHPRHFFRSTNFLTLLADWLPLAGFAPGILEASLRLSESVIFLRGFTGVFKTAAGFPLA